MLVVVVPLLMLSMMTWCRWWETGADPTFLALDVITGGCVVVAAKTIIDPVVPAF